jgi:hypothetical protein
MKLSTPAFYLACILCVGAVLIPGCAQPVTPAQVQQLNQSVQDGKAALVQTQAAIAELKATAATQPGGAAVVAGVTKIEKPLAQLATNADRISTVTQVAATASTQPGADVFTVGVSTVQAAAPFLPEPYRTYVLLGTTALGFLGTLLKSRQAASANLASVQMTNGVQQAFANGALTATPAAAAIVDSNLTVTHAASDALVDVVKAAGTPAAK